MTYFGDIEVCGVEASVEFEYQPEIPATRVDPCQPEEFRVSFFTLCGSDDLADTEIMEPLDGLVYAACMELIADLAKEGEIERARMREEELMDGYDLEAV